MQKNWIIYWLLTFSICYSAFSQGFLKRQNKKIVNEQGEIILKGIGLGGWMLQEGYMLQTESFANAQYEIRAKIEALIGKQNTNAFYEAWLANHCRKIDVDSLAAWGFNSIRLPLHYNLFTLPIEEEPVKGENTWLENGFHLTDNLLAWCQANKIYLILDLHATPGGQGKNAAISDYNPQKPSLWESAENRDKTVALWRKLAQRYANESWIGGYDLINETNWNLPNNALLKQLYIEITKAIREVDTNHIIFIEGNWFANDFTGLTPPWDENMVYSFHKYWSYNDIGSITWMLNIRNKYNVPVWCGEAGENSNVWFTDAIKLLEDNNIGWAWWPMKKVASISGPLSIKKTEGYQELLEYWNGNAGKPSPEYARSTLMELTENLKLENCQYNRDVIDAMIRQPQTDQTIPFKEHQIPGIIFAVDYDLGKQNYAYYDTEVADYHVSSGTWTGWNNGWVYRNDGVDIESCSDTDITNGFNVGWIDKGEWLTYTVESKYSAIYNIKLRVASPAQSGRFYIQLDNNTVSEVIPVRSTGGWQNWADIVVNEINIEKGKHVIKLYFDEGPFNLNYFEFIKIKSLDDESKSIEYDLYQNYPNPFNQATIIPFRLSSSAFISLKIFDLLGNEIETLIKGEQAAGAYKLKLEVKNLASGVYFYRLKVDNHSKVKKLVLQK